MPSDSWVTWQKSCTSIGWGIGFHETSFTRKKHAPSGETSFWNLQKHETHPHTQLNLLRNTCFETSFWNLFPRVWRPLHSILCWNLYDGEFLGVIFRMTPVHLPPASCLSGTTLSQTAPLVQHNSWTQPVLCSRCNKWFLQVRENLFHVSENVRQASNTWNSRKYMEVGRYIYGYTPPTSLYTTVWMRLCLADLMLTVGILITLSYPLHYRFQALTPLVGGLPRALFMYNDNWCHSCV